VPHKSTNEKNINTELENKAHIAVARVCPWWRVREVGAITNRPQIVDDASGRLIIAPTTVSNVIKGMKSYVTKQIGFFCGKNHFTLIVLHIVLRYVIFKT